MCNERPPRRKHSPLAADRHALPCGYRDSRVGGHVPWDYPWPHQSPLALWTASQPPNPSALTPASLSAQPASLDSSGPNWLQTAMSNGGIFGSPAQPAVDPWSDPRLTPSQPPMPPLSLSGLSSLFSSTPPTSGWNPGSPASQPAPVGANAGFRAPPTQPALDWRNGPRLATYAQMPSAPMTPPNLPGLTSLLSSAPPAAPLGHLDSGKYWPAGPAPSGIFEQPPTHPADLEAQTSSQPPNPRSWNTSALSLGAQRNPVDGRTARETAPTEYSVAEEQLLPPKSAPQSSLRTSRSLWRLRETKPRRKPREPS
jgi:hypothetical protein